jgi:LysM repeat protein
MDTYTVKAGDSLAKIALKLYGDANKWRELADLNGIADPGKIKIGQLLNLIPKKPSTTGVKDSEISIEGKKHFTGLKAAQKRSFLVIYLNWDFQEPAVLIQSISLLIMLYCYRVLN